MKEQHASWLERHITLQHYDDAKAERENWLTHLYGAILSLAALIVILVRTPQIKSASLKAGMIVYGLSMLLLYSASALYHKLPPSDGKRLCRIFDHTNIYLLIAGTYTPIMCAVGNPTAIKVLRLVWIIAACGIAFTLLFWGRLRPLHVVWYLAMGWLIVFYWNGIAPFLPKGLPAYILAAGVTYSIGVVFYACKRIPHYHAIWHLFCIGGSLLFFIGFQTQLY